MFTRILAIAAFSLGGVAAHAQEAADLSQFTEASQASSWNLAFEVAARFDATVVDLACEVAGDCDNACTAGRQLALVRHADGVLVYPTKNNQGIFTGAAVDLLPFCGMEVEVDGLLIDDSYIGAVNVYQVQCIRELGTNNWTVANGWTDQWAEDFPDAAAQSGRWYRNDPRIVALLEADGYLGTSETWEEAWEVTR